ncbi:MAG: deoxyribonuclease IV [Candidatus Dasytiphilus stammeri]
MKYIGVHVSITGGLENAVLQAHYLNASAFALFVKNPRQWMSVPMNEESINNFIKFCKKYNFTSNQIVPHTSYLINLGHPVKYNLEKSRESFIDEINRCNKLKLKFINFHPGSHLNQISILSCIKRIAESINIAFDNTTNIIGLIENTAGQGSTIGHSFEQIASIIDQVEDKSRIGVCFDTCHAFSAGYNFTTQETYQKTFLDFDKIISLTYLRAMHLNDSKNFINSRIDRHENLGKGNIGLPFFRWIIKDVRFEQIPMILETPNFLIWKEEIAWLKRIAENKS